MSIDSPDRVATAPVEILHVDDDPSVLDLTRSFLETELEGAQITIASDPDQGFSRSHQKAHDSVQ